MKKTIAALSCFCLLIILSSEPVLAQTSLEAQKASLRSFDRLFPNLEANRRNAVFSDGGIIRSIGKNGSLEIIPSPDSGISLHRTIMSKNPSFMAESLMIIPYSGKVPTQLDAYNALGKIRDLKGRLYSSHSRGAEVPLFEDATRLESDKKSNPVADPPPAHTLPASDTVYIRLKDINFGNSYYKASFSTGQYGVTYNLTNYKSLSYLFLTVMDEEKFSAILYIEPLAEGIMVYSVAGAGASDFISGRIDIPSAIRKRLAVFIGWVGDGLKLVK